MKIQQIKTLAAEICGGLEACKNDNALPGIIVNIINAVITISSIVAVIFIIVGGVQYMASAGDSGKVQKAKNTILYAVIGLVICVLAFAIVNFVINNIISSNSK